MHIKNKKNRNIDCARVNSATGGAVYQEGNDFLVVDCVWSLDNDRLDMALRFTAIPHDIAGMHPNPILNFTVNFHLQFQLKGCPL